MYPQIAVSPFACCPRAFRLARARAGRVELKKAMENAYFQTLAYKAK
jgi:hypothetical protein